ncbi:MAG: efflux RND transporter permease subunit [Nitrospirales bacterium]|nr:efflux RND transporter permease subunit [Nitrospirales bacterium]
MEHKDSPSSSLQTSGPLAWMVQNRVTPNLLMLTLLLGGLFMASQIKQEVFPEFEEDTVTITVPFPGASPEEVEHGVILAIEEGVRGLEGVSEIRATASENQGTVVVELLANSNNQKIYQDIQQAINRIVTFPEDTEKPRVTLDTRRRDVLTLQLYGDVSEWTLREAAEQVRDRLLQESGITQIDLEGARAYEIHVEVSQEDLRAYGLTLEGIAQTISATALDRSGGSVETSSGEILLRVQERRNWASDFADIPIIANQTGTLLRLGDIAHISEGFQESETFATFNGVRAIGIEVYRVGDQTPIGVSKSVHAAMARIVPDLPSAIEYTVLKDRSEIYYQRLTLLLKNGFLGLLLVLAILSLFLEYKLAFWVTVGIPTSFLGAILFLPIMDVSINMISLFAFIIALGIVVDDAIIAGENIYEYRQRGKSFGEAAILGARDIAVPISFSILTNIIAFLPLMFVPGSFGKIWAVIPVVVSAAFIISWIEALFVLPAHLAHSGTNPTGTIGAAVHRTQQRFSVWFTRFVEKTYGPFLRRATEHRYLCMAIGFGIFAIVLAYPFSGRMGFILMPTVEADFAKATAVLPFGSPRSEMIRIRDGLIHSVQEVIDRYPGQKISTGTFALVLENTVDVRAYLPDPDHRPLSTSELTALWRERTPDFPGVQYVRFESDSGGPGRGASISVELSHRNIDMLDTASTDLADRLAEFESVKDVDDGYSPGKPQLDFRINEEARSLGLTAGEVARQARNAFYGSEALRQQRGRNEIKVLVRFPASERESEYHVENLVLRTPAGPHVPLYQVATVEKGRAFREITRRDGHRTVTVTANVQPVKETNLVLNRLKNDVLPILLRDYPGLSYTFEGRQADMRDALQSFLYSSTLALILIYVLLAVPFRSYLQPAIVMAAIPFGVVGAVIGHMIMGYSISIISMMGIIALGGVVVNDSLIMIDYANAKRREGHNALEAICQAGIRRFRPILLTTLTTFGGLGPMIFETSRQARFMIPMAISLGYGILFATAIMLVLIPCLYLIVEDLLAMVTTVETPAPESIPKAPDALVAE